MDMLERLQGEGALLGKLRCLFQVLRGKAPACPAAGVERRSALRRLISNLKPA